MTSTKLLFYVKLFVLYIAVCHANAVGSVSVSASWQGGSSTCKNCSAGTYVLNFACNDGRGDFNDGKVLFHDPIPAGGGNILYNVTGTLQGWFGCASPPLGMMFLNGVSLSAQHLPASGECSCPNCVSGVTFLSDNFPNGMPSYSYGKNVTLQVQAIGNSPSVLCLSSVKVTIAYGPTHYAIKRIYPTNGPREGGTQVTIVGEHFSETVLPLCSFGGIQTSATFVNNSVLTCVSPPSTCLEFPCEVFLEIGATNMGFTHNRVKFYYKEHDNSPLASEKNLLLQTILGVGVTCAVILLSAAGFMLYQKNKTQIIIVPEHTLLVN